MDMQRIMLAGHVTKDAELISSKAGTNFAVFTLAVNRAFSKDTEKQREANFYDIICFGEERAKVIESKVKKGDLVFVEGRPEAEAYTDKSGEPKAAIKVIVDTWQVIK